MRRQLRTLVSAALIATAAGLLSLPSGASAAPTLQQRLNVVPHPWLSPVFDDLQEGRPAGRVLKDVLCPPAGEVDELVNGIGRVRDITGPIKTASCGLDLLDFEFHTEFRKPDGSLIVKNVRAIVNVPTFLSVDEDPSPEFTATIQLLSRDRLTLQVDRIGGVQKPLPASVEALVADPSGGSMSRERIAYGFDAKPSSAPTQWETVLRLTDVFGQADPIRLGVDISQTGATGPIALIAELFNPGSSSMARRDRIAGRVQFDPPPKRMSVDVAVGDRTEANLRTATPTRADALLRIQEDDDEKRIEATIDKLPRQVDIAFEDSGSDRRRIDYDAIAPIDSLQAKFTDRKGAPHFDIVETTAEASIKGIPQGITVQQTGARSGKLTTRGGKIERIDGAFASGGAPLKQTEDGHYAKLVQDEGVSSMAFRLLGLERAQFTGTSPVLVDAVIEPGPMRAIVNTPELDLNAVIRDLPHSVRLLLDLEAPRLIYDGNGAEIQEIRLDAQSPKAFFGRATHIQGLVRGIPSSTQLDLKQQGDAIEFVTDNPIDEVELLASDGHDEGLPVGEQGVIFRDQQHRWTLFGRIFGLRQVRMNPEPLSILVRAGAGRPFRADATIEQPGDDLEVRGRIENLPRRVAVHLSQDSTGTALVYNADAPIGRILLEGNNLEQIDRADDFRVELTKVPTHVQAQLPEAGPLIIAAATPDPVGSLQLQLADGGFEQLAPGQDGAIYIDTPSRFAVTAKISNLRTLRLGTDPTPDVFLDLPSAPNPFDFRIERQQFADEPLEFLRGAVDRPQARTLVKIQTEPNLKLDYSAGGPIESIAMQTNAGDIGLIDATLSNLPRELSVCIDSGRACGRENSTIAGDLTATIDDNNSSHGPFVLNGLICLEPNSDVDCQNPGLRKKFVTIENLQLREFHLTAEADGTATRAFIDTDNKDVRGKIEYRDSGLPIIDGFRVKLPAGFRALDRRAGGGLSFGTINCPSGTEIGTISPDINLAGILCP